MIQRLKEDPAKYHIIAGLWMQELFKMKLYTKFFHQPTGNGSGEPIGEWKDAGWTKRDGKEIPLQIFEERKYIDEHV